MTQEEIIKRNEAIVLLEGAEIHPYEISNKTVKMVHYKSGAQFNRVAKYIMGLDTYKIDLRDLGYHKNWEQLMPAYLHIKSLGYHGTIEDLGKPGHRVYFTDKNFKEYLPGNRHEDLITAIWLTVSDFAMVFNKKNNGN